MGDNIPPTQNRIGEFINILLVFVADVLSYLEILFIFFIFYLIRINVL